MALLSAGTKLLVVEDEPMLRRVIARTLRRRGFDVIEASSCAEARACAGRFCAGVFDLELGDGLGVTLARELLRDGCVQTATFFSGSPERARALGGLLLGEVIDKAEGMHALVAALERALGRQPGQAVALAS